MFLLQEVDKEFKKIVQSNDLVS